ncbi:twin-arginine translocase subunit TatC [bacterium]|nr:twin-arginine translocase subunit TatC [bacterium]
MADIEKVKTSELFYGKSGQPAGAKPAPAASGAAASVSAEPEASAAAGVWAAPPVSSAADASEDEYEPQIEPVSDDEIIDSDKSLSMSDHLEELRRRILVCLGSWIAVSCLAYSRVDFMLAKIRALAGDNFTFVYTSPTEAFTAYIKLALTAGLVAVLPIIFYETAAFVNPGLKRGERRLMLRLIPCGLAFFCLGALFAWFVALPIMWKFFLSFQGAGITALWTIGEVVGFVAGMLLICGLIFELPLLIILAARMGLVTYEKMAAGRRMTYFLILLLTAVVTPTPDAFTCLVVSVPIAALFELSLLAVRFQEKALCRKSAGA